MSVKKSLKLKPRARTEDSSNRGIPAEYRPEIVLAREPVTPLTYQDLALGNYAREVYERVRATSGEEEARKAVAGMPVYCNSRNVFGNLNTTDLIIAGVLAGQNVCLVGPTGRGKSQVAEDIAEHFFGGEYADGGSSVIVKGSNNLESIDPIFLTPNTRTMNFVETGAHNSAFYNLEEFNRCVDIVQNQFYDLLNHRFISNTQGIALPLGVDGFSSIIATANPPGTNDGKGTFESPSSLWNRFGVILDQVNDLYRLTKEDEDFYQLHRGQSGSGVMSSSRKNLLRKILEANKQIASTHMLSNPEALSAFLMATRGLKTFPCSREKESLGENWYSHIPCGNGCTDDFAHLRTWVAPPWGRGPLDIQRYAAALKYLSRLKDPNSNIPDSEFVFRAFELNGAYQPGVLNPNVLTSKFEGDNHKMMREVTDRLCAEFNSSERGQRLRASVARAMKGKETQFFKSPSGKIIPSSAGEIPKDVRDQFEQVDSGLDSSGDVDYSPILSSVNYGRDLNPKGN